MNDSGYLTLVKATLYVTFTQKYSLKKINSLTYFFSLYDRHIHSHLVRTLFSPEPITYMGIYFEKVYHVALNYFV